MRHIRCILSFVDHGWRARNEIPTCAHVSALYTSKIRSICSLPPAQSLQPAYMEHADSVAQSWTHDWSWVLCVAERDNAGHSIERSKKLAAPYSVDCEIFRAKRDHGSYHFSLLDRSSTPRCDRRSCPWLLTWQNNGYVFTLIHPNKLNSKVTWCLSALQFLHRIGS